MHARLSSFKCRSAGLVNKFCNSLKHVQQGVEINLSDTLLAIYDRHHKPPFYSIEKDKKFM